MNANSTNSYLPIRQVFRTWWPLAASWMLMGAELPLISSIIARLANPEINLAAYGGVVFPLALIIEAPVIMLLAASTALSKDWASYLKLRRFMMATAAALTLLHVIVAFTPVYYLVVQGILGVPDEIVAPARIGLMIMTPWTWAIAYRRFNQGVLIRFGHSRSIGVGTVIRLSTGAVVLAVGYSIGGLPGIIVGTTAVAVGVVFEAIYVGIVVRPVREKHLKPAPPVATPLTLKAFLNFYIPLALTSLLILLTLPLGSAALSRMPLPLESLAAWPVVSGLIFMVRGMGMAYNEVVVSLLDEKRSTRTLKRFAHGLAGLNTVALVILAATPLSQLWFRHVAALNPELVQLARLALWFGILLPGLNVYQSLYQGALVNSRRTRGVTEAVVIFLASTVIILYGGILWGQVIGLFIGMGAFTVSMLVQTVWLWHRSRPTIRATEARDASLSGVKVFEAVTD
jgi:hypothetical protein